MVVASHEKSGGWADDRQRNSTSLFVKGSWLMDPGSSLDMVLLHHRNRQALASDVPLAADGRVVELLRGRRANNIDNAQVDTLYAIWNQRLTAAWALKLSASIGQLAPVCVHGRASAGTCSTRAAIHFGRAGATRVGAAPGQPSCAERLAPAPWRTTALPGAACRPRPGCGGPKCRQALRRLRLRSSGATGPASAAAQLPRPA